MLRAIIIDDEQSGIDMLTELLRAHTDCIRVVASTQQAELGVRLIDDFQPDVLFLDISMPTMNGFDILQRVSYHDFRTVFSTAHRDYAIEAIRRKAFDYLLKPLNESDFERCMRNLIAEGRPEHSAVRPEKQTFVEVTARDGIHYLRLADIVRVEASGSYTIFHLSDGSRHVASRSLKEFESRLDPNIFFRCHHSHIVNLLQVKQFVNHQGYFVRMSDGTLTDVSKKCKEELLERLKTI
jgi:two-component system, LytTR family, response regulator